MKHPNTMDDRITYVIFSFQLVFASNYLKLRNSLIYMKTENIYGPNFPFQNWFKLSGCYRFRSRTDLYFLAVPVLVLELTVFSGCSGSGSVTLQYIYVLSLLHLTRLPDFLPVTPNAIYFHISYSQQKYLCHGAVAQIHSWNSLEQHKAMTQSRNQKMR